MVKVFQLWRVTARKESELRRLTQAENQTKAKMDALIEKLKKKPKPQSLIIESIEGRGFEIFEFIFVSCFMF